MAREPMSRDRLLALPTVVNMETAGEALGVERTQAYRLAKQNKFPVPVLQVGSRLRVPTAPLLRYLGIDPTESVHRDDTQPATSADEQANRRTNSRDDEPVIVTMRSGKKRLIYPNDTYRMKSGRRVLGSEIIEKRRNAS